MAIPRWSFSGQNEHQVKWTIKQEDGQTENETELKDEERNNVKLG
jgi:hypothetical protein